jgi:hypothetical protein
MAVVRLGGMSLAEPKQHRQAPQLSAMLGLLSEENREAIWA